MKADNGIRYLISIFGEPFFYLYVLDYYDQCLKAEELLCFKPECENDTCRVVKFEKSGEEFPVFFCPEHYKEWKAKKEELEK